MMKTIFGAKITFTKADLLHLDDGEKKVFYVFAHILNRTSLLEGQVFSHWAAAANLQCSPVEREAAMFGALEFIFLLAGELKEGWEAVQSCYYGAQVSKKLNPQLSTEVQQIFKKLPDYFKGSSVTYRIRNDFSYHHSPDKILTTIQLLSEDDLHEAYLLEGSNNYFDYATKIRIATIAQSLGLSDWAKLMEHLISTVIGEVYRDLSHVLNAVLVALFNRLSSHKNESIELRDIPSSDELLARYFFYID